MRPTLGASRRLAPRISTIFSRTSRTGLGASKLGGGETKIVASTSERGASHRRRGAALERSPIDRSRGDEDQEVLVGSSAPKVPEYGHLAVRHVDLARYLHDLCARGGCGGGRLLRTPSQA